MKRTVFCVVLMVSLVSIGTASAGKIGFVDVQKAISQVDEGKATIKELDEWANGAREELRVIAVKYRELKDLVAKQAPVATVESVALLQAEETTLRREMEDAQREYDRLTKSKTEKFFKEVGSKVGIVGRDYGNANGFDAIFIFNEQPMVFVADQADLTDVVVRLYNERFPVK